MQHQELIGRQCDFGVRPPFVVGEFNFTSVIEQLDDGADLSTE